MVDSQNSSILRFKIMAAHLVANKADGIARGPFLPRIKPLRQREVFLVGSSARTEEAGPHKSKVMVMKHGGFNI